MSVPTDPAPLMSTDEAAAHLREVLDGMPTEKLADLELKILIASAVVLDYLKGQADPTWDETTVPLVVKAAALQYLGMLWEHRGDDETSGSYGSDFDARAWDAMDRILKRRRDPTLQ